MNKSMKLNRNHLKYVAIVAMLIDHVAWSFVPTLSLEGQLMHFVGRLTGPIMAFMVAEGYQHTKDVKKYALRLGLFALISWVPYSLHSNHAWPTPDVGVILTLFLGLMVTWIWDKAPIITVWKVVIVIGACILSVFCGDWPIFDVLWPLYLFLYRDDEKKKWTAFTVIIIAEVVLTQLMAISNGHPYSQLFQFGAFMVPPLLIWGYNGEPGSRNPFHKWFFYVFYPAHLLILYFIEMALA